MINRKPAHAPNTDSSTAVSGALPFQARHIGPRETEWDEMAQSCGFSSLDELIDHTVPAGIRFKSDLNLPPTLSEHGALTELKGVMSKNHTARSFIGLGYYDTVTPAPILRNILENPGWYTQYTPYQAEIAQGRLEALLNFQTLIVDLTGMEIANASLLDEGTAAAEACVLAFRSRGSETRNRFFISDGTHPQTIDVVRTRAEPLGVQVVVGSEDRDYDATQCFGILLQYPGTDGLVKDYSAVTLKARHEKSVVIVAADLLSLALLKPPGEWGADIVVGNSQRFGVPLGFGGPHAAFFATRDEFKRQIPGRLIGVSKDADGNNGYRLTLQTREQHIRRDKATSNICTAQVLLAVMASMYAVYHGPEGLRAIATRVHKLARTIQDRLKKNGFASVHSSFFDTIRVSAREKREEILARSKKASINLRSFADGSLGIALDEATTFSELNALLDLFVPGAGVVTESELSATAVEIPANLLRTSDFLTHPIFRTHRSEAELTRYIHKLQKRDLSLTHSMIPLGSCTMKLNAASEMLPVTWSEVGRVHPFAPAEQTEGYADLTNSLKQMLCEITGLDGCSLQPNSGAQGEYAGLLSIRGYLKSIGQESRNIVLIPESAHGTNPASAVLAGFKVVPVKCDKVGSVDLPDLRAKAEEHKANVAALMVTYPSTHGVFEEGIIEICKIVHGVGGQVYMDGANLNAQVGLCRAAEFGVDVCHINLHKTFCIPHGGGGPGVGPICVKKHLVPFLPGIPGAGQANTVGPVSAANEGSASILVIPWVYIRMMGAKGLESATKVAILNANYVANRLQEYYPVMYRGVNGTVAHECILDLRKLQEESGIEVGDVAKRLMDYGFHAPTVSWPVAGTLMVEPTESESRSELDRFCDAMILIHAEILAVKDGRYPRDNNPLKNSPHTAAMLTTETWDLPYSREVAVFPAPWVKENKFWPAVRRIDNVYGDRNLFCTCSPMTEA